MQTQNYTPHYTNTTQRINTMQYIILGSFEIEKSTIVDAPIEIKITRL